MKSPGGTSERFGPVGQSASEISLFFVFTIQGSVLAKRSGVKSCSGVYQKLESGLRRPISQIDVL